MWAALALVLASATTAPVVALLPLRPLGAPPDVVHALEVTLRNELAQLPEARLASARDVAAANLASGSCASSLRSVTSRA